MNSSFLNRCGQYVTYVVLMAMICYVSGRLGLLLSIPPSQATAIWPPAGIGLAVLLIKGIRYFPAIFLGAILTSLYHYDVIGLKELTVAAAIASGACLQAVIGCLFIRKFIKLPTPLEDIKEPVLVIILGGVFACLINALIGNATIYFAGYSALPALPIDFFTWWVGDVLGVVVFTPICLLLFFPKHKEYTVSRLRKVTILTCTTLILIAVVYIFQITKEYETREKLEAFNKQTYDLSRILQEEITSSVNVLSANERFLSSSEYVSAVEFKEFTKHYFALHSGVYGLSWIPKVTADERLGFVQSVREQGYPEFEIRRRFEIGKMDKSEEKSVYFPITYTQPYKLNYRAHGLDVYGKDPVVGDLRIKLLDYARDTGMVVATKRFPIVQAEDQYGFIMYYPVYSKDVSKLSVKERRKALVGYCNGIFIFPTLMRDIADQASKQGVDVVLYDVDQEEQTQTLLFDSRTPDFKEPAEPISIVRNNNKLVHYYKVAGRVWRMDFIQRPIDGAQPDWLLWVVLTGGLLFTGLTSLFVLLITARTEVVQRLVDEKTKEIQDSNAFLELMMSHNPDLIFVKDELLNIVQANKAFLDTYPEDMRDDVIGASSTEDYSMEDYVEFTAMDRKAFKDGYSEIVETITFPDGMTRTLFTQKIRFERADGERFILGLARDVTEKEALIQQLSESNAELEEFAYRTSHDLRSPLLSSVKLLSMAEHAIADEDLAKAGKCMEHTRLSLQKLENLVLDILSLTETKSADEGIENVDVSDVLDEALEKLAYMDGFDRVTLKMDVEVDRLVRVKRNRVALIIENMVSNSVKYQDPEEDEPYIHISAKVVNRHLVFTVEDNGLGIPEDQQEDMFTMFKRFHPKVSYGSGLGLYMMRKSAQVIGGRITFEQPDKGARFKLTLPLDI